MPLKTLGVLALLACGAQAHAQDLDWLAGRWCGTDDGTFQEELWLPERGGLLLGLHRDVRDGAPAAFEYLRIVRGTGGTTLHAQPAGAAPVAFAESRHDGRMIEFANPAHDFPRRIRYRLLEDGRLQASVDDGSDSGARMQWTWRRDCDAAASGSGSPSGMQKGAGSAGLRP